MVEFSIVGDENIAASRILVPIAIATVLPGVVVPTSGGGGGGGTIQGTVAVATILSPVAISGSVTAAPPAYIGTLASMGTLGTLLSPVAVAGGTVGTLQAMSNIAVASLVGSVGSPVALAGGTVGTLQSLANMAVASLVGSIGSPVAMAGGTVGTIQSGVTDIGTIYGGSNIDPLYGPANWWIATLGISSIVVPSESYFALPAQTTNRRLFNITAAALGGTAAGTLEVFNAGSLFMQMVVPAQDTRFWENPRGVKLANATLYASIAGTMCVVFVSS